MRHNQKSTNFMRINNIEDDHGDEHQHCIKNVYIHLMVQKIPVVSLDVFSQSKYRADHDQKARHIEHVQVFAPGNVWRTGARNWVSLKLPVEMGGGDDEEPKEEDLNKEASDDDVFAFL